MKLILTNQGDNRQLLVESDSIRLAESVPDGTHIVFASDMGRIVNESLASIVAVVGASVVSPQPASVTVAKAAQLSRKD